MPQKTKKQLQQSLKELTQEKGRLLELQKADAKSFTSEQQERLAEITETIVDLEEQIELMSDEKVEEKRSYVVPKGTENMVHVKVAFGNRFDPKTGKEVNFPYLQMFNFGEWELFKKNFATLGYAIIEVLHDPTGEAKALIEK